MATNSPLLAREEDTETPALGGTQAGDVEQSPLERLIAQSTSEQAQSVSFLLDEPLDHAPGPLLVQQPSITQSAGSSLATVAAGSLCLCQAGLVWASFLSTSWFDTHLIISVPWQQEYFPFLNNALDQLLRSTTLASLLSTFVGAEQHWASITLLASSLILPCLCMILLPAWTVGDHQERLAIRPTASKTCQLPRAFFEYMIRLSLLAFFLLALLDVGTSSIDMVNHGSKFSIVNRTRGGLVCYTIGVFCALGVVVILRFSKGGQNEYTTSHPSPSENVYSRRSPRAPPNRAFQLPWQIVANETSPEQQQPLLTRSSNSEDARLTSNYSGQVESMQIEQGVEEVPSMSFYKKMILFEFAIISTLLWLPALFLPLFKLHYGGLVSAFVSENSFSIQLWELPAVLWQRGVTAGTPHWMLVVLGTILITVVYALPMLATILAISTWRTKSTASFICRNVLGLIQPCLSGIVFAVSMLLAIPSFEPIGGYLLDEESSGFCKKFEVVTDDTCLTINGKPELGLWFLLAQSISLEIFVILTLWWKR